MTLYRQLWISIALLMTISFLGSFIISCISAKVYLEEQLALKNIDNASSIALTLSNNFNDETMLELYVNSQFDTGHYQFIHLIGTGGKVIAEQYDRSEITGAPAWLMKIFPITSTPGVAQVSNGWQRLGTLTLNSNVGFAYAQLWANTQQFFVYFLLVSISAGLMGSIILRRLTVPLHKAVQQAQALSERRFITHPEPKTLEFKSLIQSMNRLSTHMHNIVKNEATSLLNWQHEGRYDRTTGLLNREPILAKFTQMADEDSGTQGGLILIRIMDVFALNQCLGRHKVDSLLFEVGQVIRHQLKKLEQPLADAGRLNGSDFLIILPSEVEQVGQYGQRVLDAVQEHANQLQLAEDNIDICASASPYFLQEPLSLLLTRLDRGLSSAAQALSRCNVIQTAGKLSKEEIQHQKKQLLQSLEDQNCHITFHAVINDENHISHKEPELILISNGKELRREDYLIYAKDCHLTTKLESLYIENILDTLSSKKQALSIKLSSDFLNSPTMIERLINRLQEQPDITHLVHIELSELTAFQDLEALRQLCRRLHQLHCRIGLRGAGQEITQFGDLHDIGLDYIKLDAVLIRHVDTNIANQIFLRGLCTLLHTLGLHVYASGIKNNQEWEMLLALGIDGGSGELFDHLLE